MLNLTSLLSKVRLANLGLGIASCIEGNEVRISAWNYGELELSDGKLVAIYPRWWPRKGSHWEAVQDSYLRSLPTDVCRAYYAFPRRAPGFMSVLYALSGANTQYKTLLRAMVTMDEIARLKDADAIVCQAISSRTSERLLNRWGYVRHAFAVGDNHFIKRLK